MAKKIINYGTPFIESYFVDFKCLSYNAEEYEKEVETAELIGVVKPKPVPIFVDICIDLKQVNTFKSFTDFDNKTYTAVFLKSGENFVVNISYQEFHKLFFELIK